jgi:uncharacterized membrane protein YvbJ
MPYCPKCGKEVQEDTAFCPNCGAALKISENADWKQQMRQRRSEWKEQRRQWGEERRAARRGEKAEKTEKHEHPFLRALVIGSILIILGVLAFLAATETLASDVATAYFFIVVGAMIVALAVYAAILAARRHPKT